MLCTVDVQRAPFWADAVGLHSVSATTASDMVGVYRCLVVTVMLQI